MKEKLLIESPKQGRKYRQRVGRGPASGVGKTCGAGESGQKKRSGGSIRIGFEGGQMPLYRRLPQRGFSNAKFAPQSRLVSLNRVHDAFSDGATISDKSLVDKKLVKLNKKNSRFDIKIVSPVELKKRFIIDTQTCSVSQSVSQEIIKAGGQLGIDSTLAKNANKSQGK